MPKLTKLISGGQTGADRGGLDAAIEIGIPHGGWCPLGRLAEDGRVPEKYQLTEAFSANYSVRTNRNVVDADGTVIFTLSGKPASNSGSGLTLKFCKRNKKPCLVVDLSQDEEGSREIFGAWLNKHHIQILNVAGSRESEAPGICDRVRTFLLSALRN